MRDEVQDRDDEVYDEGRVEVDMIGNDGDAFEDDDGG